MLVIGAATAVLAVVSATFIRPLPFPAGDRLVQLFLMPPDAQQWSDRNPQSIGTFLRLRQNLKQTELVEGVWSRERALGGETEPEIVVAGAVSPGVFDIFGGRLVHGRTFTEVEDQSNAKVVVLGHTIWQQRFGGDASVIGRTVLIDREPHQVIGVMAQGFETGFFPTVLWTPLNATEKGVASGNTFVLTYARLRPGVTVAQLQSEIDPLMKTIVAENPKVLTGWSALGVGLRDAQFRIRQPSLIALAAGVAALLILACANLANLTLAQIAARRSQMALRFVLGSSHLALIRLQVIESLFLAAAGSLGGLALGSWMLPALLALDPSLARTFGRIHLDWRVQAAVALAAVVVSLLAGLVPLLRELRGNLQRSIGEGGRRLIGSRRDRRWRSLLVGAQCALAVVLLACAALLLGAFSRTSKLDPGFNPRSVLTAQVRIPAAAYPTEAARADLIARILDAVRLVPGVDSAGATLNRFQPGFFFVTRIDIEGQPPPDGRQHVVQFRRASAGYFETMRVPVLSGREFSATDTLDQPRVAIVSRQLADRYWPGVDPIGKRVLRGAPAVPLTVIGVVGDVRDVAMSDPPAATIYIPFSQNNVALTPVSLVVRAKQDPVALAASVRAAVLAVDAQQPVDSLLTLEQFLADSLGPQRFRSVLLMVLGGIGLALAALGVYGITSRAVVERTPEFGVRLALGATPKSLVGQVVRQSLRVVLIGLAAGVGVTVPAVLALIRWLPNLDLMEAWSSAPAILVLAIVATAAAFIPARRASALSPIAALSGR
jgi:putative ABC transport system permease protein